MFLGKRLHTQTRSHLGTFGVRFGLPDQFMQSLPLSFGVEVSEAAGIVVGSQLFADAAVLFARDVASGKMQQP